MTKIVDAHATLSGMITNLTDQQAKAMIILLRTGVSEIATATADAARAPAAKPARATRAAKADPAPAKPARATRRAAPEAVADVADDMDGDADEPNVTLPENPTVEDLFDYLDTIEITPQKRKITEAKKDAESFGGDIKAIEAGAEGTDIGARRDALEEFVAQCEALHGELIELSAEELKTLMGELGLDAATIKSDYGAYNKDVTATAIIVAINGDDDEAEEDGVEEELDDEPVAPAKPARAARAAAPAASGKRRQAPAAPAAPAKAQSGGRRRAVADADDLGDLEDL